MQVTIAVDAMGGDHGPPVTVAASLRFLAETRDARIVLVGNEDAIRKALAAAQSAVLARVSVRPASEIVAMHEPPADALRRKKDSSMRIAINLVKEGAAQACVSAGNTGAMLAACLLELRRIPGVRRPAIAVTIPARRGASVLLDSGANADARPEDLLQFAHMGAVFAREILDVRDPEIRLLSIGEEREKGNQLTLEAHDLLAASDLNFGGNTEGRDLLRGAADVVVTDGFTGNVVLKLLEGTITNVLDSFREEITATTRGKLGGLLIRPAARRLRNRLDPDTYGGAYLLGLRGLAVIAHGNSSSRAVANAIRLAARGVDHDVVGRLAQPVGDTVLESAPSTTPTPT